MKMKAAYILTTYPCRSELFVQREIRSLQRLGFDVAILAALGATEKCNKSQSESIYYRPLRLSGQAVTGIAYVAIRYPLSGFRLLFLVCRMLLYAWHDAWVILGNLHTIACFIKFLDDNHIQHVHGYFLSWPGCIALAISIVSKRSYSLAGHSRDIYVKREIGSLSLKVRGAKFVIVCTEIALEYLRRQLPCCLHNKLHLVYHSLEPVVHCEAEEFPLSQSGDYPIKLLSVGRMVEKKGFLHLLRSFALVHRVYDNITVYIAGDGPQYQNILELAEELDISRSTYLMGWQEQDQVTQLLRDASVLVVPSIVSGDGDRDGIPNVILEAFINRVPVVAFDTGAIREAVIDETTGLLVPVGDIQQLAAAITRLLGNIELQDKLVNNAFCLVREKFNPTRNASMIAALFANV